MCIQSRRLFCSSAHAGAKFRLQDISRLGRKVMVVMTVMGSNVVMKNSSNGSNGSNHEMANLKMDHVIIEQSIVEFW